MKKILIVDDEFLIRYSLSQMLTNASVDVISVTTGTEALKELSALSFDICFLDIHLPDMDGMDIMKKISQTAPRTKIIMMTGGAVSAAMLEEIRSSSELFLSKPFDLFKLKMFVDRILASDTAGCRDEGGHLQNPETSLFHVMSDQRRHERRPASRRVAYSALPSRHEEEQTAELIDISEGGMCLMTTYLLPRGVILRICNNKTDYCTGRVRWSMQTGNENLYRAGIELTQPDSPNVSAFCKKNAENPAPSEAVDGSSRGGQS